MENEFKYEIWNLSEYITKLESISKDTLSAEELKKISGGSAARKISAGILLGVSLLTGMPGTAQNVFAATPSVLTSSQKETENQESNFEITKEQATEDINYVLKVIKEHHVSSVEKIPDEVTNQAKVEIENLADKISAVDEWRTISRILVKLHDAHTAVLPPKFLDKRLPFDTEYENGKFVCKSGDFKGCEITSINDISIAELYNTFQSHFSHELNEWTQHNFFEAPSDFIPEWKFALCGIDTSTSIKVSFKTESGIQSQNFEVSEILKPNEDSENWISYEIDEKNSLGIFKLDRCFFNDEYGKILLEFLKEISEKKIKNIAIDLRKNVGGDSRPGIIFAAALKCLSEFKGMAVDVREGDKLLRRPHAVITKDDIESYRIKRLGENYDKSILFDGSVFLLTSHRTFSAAVDFTQYFQDNGLGTVVGEIPGNSPEHFGNRVLAKDTQGSIIAVDFKTPNAGLTFRTTFKKFYRVDGSKDGTKLIPDVEVPAKDALNKVYEIIAGERKR